MAHHYRTLGAGNKEQLRIGGSLPSRQDLEGPNKWDLRLGETNGPPESIERLRQMSRDR